MDLGFKSILLWVFLGLIPGGKILILVLKESQIDPDLHHSCQGHLCWSWIAWKRLSCSTGMCTSRPGITTSHTQIYIVGCVDLGFGIWDLKYFYGYF